MQRSLTPRQEEIVALAGRLADEFAERAGEHDRENTFPAENWDRMRDDGFLRLTVPKELGGMGGGLYDLFIAQERLAQGDASTALAVTMHLSPALQFAMAWRRLRDERNEWYLRGIADGRIVVASVTSEPGMGGALLDNRTTAHRVDRGYVVNGHKMFFTESEVCTHFISNARYDDPQLGPRMLAYRTAKDVPGIALKRTWDTMGMRATQSNDVLFEDLFVPEDEIFHSFPVGHFDARVQQSIFTVAVPSFGAVFLGIAEGGMEWARQHVLRGGKQHDGEVQRHFAEMEVLLEAARSTLYRHALEVDGGSYFSLPVQDGMARGNLVKYIATNNAVEIMDRVVHVVGGLGYHRRFPVERMYRDVRAGPIMPFNNLDAHRLFAETSLGIEPVPVIGPDESGPASRPKVLEPQSGYR
jgi:alkylation response protein AidB-like acyl-CoA dehydrogenase